MKNINNIRNLLSMLVIYRIENNIAHGNISDSKIPKVIDGRKSK
jgi:hypothetical protein